MSEKFYIIGHRSSVVEENIEEKDCLSAILEFKRKNPECDISTINGKDIVDFYCACGEPIFFGDRYYSDFDQEFEDNRWCLKHGPEI